ncbi:MAG: N-acetylneuraminate lyase [Clostridia bacterium]|nr:N-acetylneuraminate lyase [Clostridia bacterium]
MESKYTGVFSALITPFTAAGDVNTVVLPQLMDFERGLGVKGFYVDGSTGESFLLSTEEREKIITGAAEANAGRSTMIAHIGAIGTKEAIRLARCAKENGYDAVSSVAPFYFRFSFDEIRRYYYDIVEAVDLPMLIYHIPAFSGVELSVEKAGVFLNDGRFLGVKYTSQDYFTLRRLKTAFPDKVIYNGFDETFLAGLSMGADGAIGSTYNFMADKFVKIRSLYLNNDVHAAAEIQKQADVIIDALCSVGVIAGVKTILCELGFDVGTVRRPFLPLPEEKKRYLLDTVLPLL